MRKNKTKMAIVTACISAILIVGATVAFFTDWDSVLNKVPTGKIDVEVEETIKGVAKSNVGALVKAKSADCWVRVFVGIPTGNHGKQLYKTTPEAILETNEDWRLQKDGYYYYQHKVSSSKEDQPLILFQSISSVDPEDPKEKLTDHDIPSCTDIIVYTEAVQYELGTSAESAFANIKNK